eukprot:GEMP01000420.1.p1 GENE.GEMP01000420.1~~GEMP01000420.1.p1  ORF type:complete len:2033 (+),score=509.14 GEMP01000420.1:482-6580(+)
MKFASAFSALPLKRFYKYVVKRLIGNFLKKDLDIEQFDVSVQLTKGVLELRDLELDVNAINEDLSNFPFKFVDGFVGTLKMDIPWGNLLKRSCQIYIEDLFITVAGQRVRVPQNANGTITNTPREGHEPLPRRQFNLSTRRDTYDPHTDEGIETLARLVKHILSNMEISVKNVQISVLSDGVIQPSVARIVSSSVNIFGGVTGGRAENRRCHVAGVSVYWIPLGGIRMPHSVSSSSSYVRNIPCEQGSLLLCSCSDTVHTIEISKGRVEDPDCLYLIPAELHYDVKIFVHSVKVTLGQAQIGALLDLVRGLELGIADVEPETLVPAPEAEKRDFWYDLYVMFEKQSEFDIDEGDEAPDSPIPELADSPVLSVATDLPVATKNFSLRMNIVKTSVFIVFSDAFEHTPWKPGIRGAMLDPQPLDCVANHMQICISKTDIAMDVLLPSSGPPEAKSTIDIGHVDGYIHERERLKQVFNAAGDEGDGVISPPAVDREELEELFYATLSDGFETASESEGDEEEEEDDEDEDGDDGEEDNEVCGSYVAPSIGIPDVSCIDPLDSLFTNNWTSAEGAWRLKRVLAISHSEDESYCASCEIKAGEVTVAPQVVEVFLCRASISVLSQLNLTREASPATGGTEDGKATLSPAPSIGALSAHSSRSGARNGSEDSSVGTGKFKFTLAMAKTVVDVALGDPRGYMVRLLGTVRETSLTRGVGTVLWVAMLRDINVQLLGAETTDACTILTADAGAFRVFQPAAHEDTGMNTALSPTMTQKGAAAAAKRPNAIHDEEDEDAPLVGWTKISVVDRPVVQQRSGKKNFLDQFRIASNRFLWPARRGVGGGNGANRRPPINLRRVPSKGSRVGANTSGAASSSTGVPTSGQPTNKGGTSPHSGAHKHSPAEDLRCDTECELHVPQVNFSMTAVALLDLQEGITAFSLTYPGDSSSLSTSAPSRPPKMAFMVRVDSLWYHVMEQECDDPLYVHVSKLRIRYVGMVGKLGLLGKDVRLLRANTLEEVIHPWYNSLRSPSEPTGGKGVGKDGVPLSFPKDNVGEHMAPFDLFDTINDKTWINNDCLMVRLDQKNRGGATHCHVDLEANGLLWRASPEIFQIYSRLWAYLVLPVEPPPETAETKARDRGTFSVYHIALKSCLFDVPGTWFAEDEGRDAISARGIVHLDDCAFSMGSLYGQMTQGVKVTVNAINGFIIDDVTNLLTRTLHCASTVPAPRFLSSLGYAHVVDIKQAKCVWKGKTEKARKKTLDGGAQPLRTKNTLTTSVEHFGFHMCSDTVQCVMKLATAVPNPTEAANHLKGHATAVVAARKNSSDAFEAQEWDDASVPGSSQCDNSVQHEGSPRKSGLGGLLIEDYIRLQKNVTPAVLVSPASPPLRPSMHDATAPQEEGLFDFEEDDDFPPASSKAATESDVVQMCMLDPDAYPKEKVQELYAAESNARHGVNAMFPERTVVGDVLHHASTSATWFEEPKNVTDDQAVGSEYQQPDGFIDTMMSSSKNASDYLWSIQVKVDDLSVNVYAGTDFQTDSLAKFQALISTDNEPQPNRLNRRQKNQCLELKLESAVFKGVGFSREKETAQHLNRIFSVVVQDFALLDRVHSSVFQHVAAYWHDDERPRVASNNMLQVVVDEFLVPRAAGMYAPTPGGIEPETPVAEYIVDARLLPLQLTVDQDTVEFCMTFLHLLTLPTYIEREASAEEADSDDQGSKDLDLIELKEIDVLKPVIKGSTGITFQQITIMPLLLSVDYRAKRLDLNALRRGEAWQLCNLLPLLEGLEVCFQRAKIARITGIGNVAQELICLWSQDIDRAQVLRTLMGVTPIRSLANIGLSMGSIIRDPLDQFFRSSPAHRVPSSILGGLTSSLRNITVETISLTETLFVSAQNILEYAESKITPTYSVARQRPMCPADDDDVLKDNWTALESGTKEFVLQPQTAGEGLLYGLEHLQRSLQNAPQAFGNPVLEMRRSGPPQSFLSSFVRGVPVMILRPAIGVSSCAATTLRGLKNHVDGGHRRKQVLDKYKGPRFRSSEADSTT